MRLAEYYISFFATSLINSIIARMLDSIKMTLNSHLCHETLKFCHYVCTVIIIVIDVIKFPENL